MAQVQVLKDGLPNVEFRLLQCGRSFFSRCTDIAQTVFRAFSRQSCSCTFSVSMGRSVPWILLHHPFELEPLLFQNQNVLKEKDELTAEVNSMEKSFSDLFKWFENRWS